MSQDNPGVQLAGQSASNLFHQVLADCADRFSSTFADAKLPDTPAAFRKGYINDVPRFEVARLASADRTAIANHLADAITAQLVFNRGEEQMSLADTLASASGDTTLEIDEGKKESGWQPTVIYRGERWDTSQIGELGEALVERNVITSNAGEALRWTRDNLLADGSLTLNKRRIAVLGAGAEMAPTRHLLDAGAEVLWIDQGPPPANWFGEHGGTLYWPAEGADLLTNPAGVLAAILAFAEGNPVDVCLYAYAPGQARELRLTVAMNAIIDALPPDLIASITILVSPTTPAELTDHDRTMMDELRTHRPFWQSLLGSAGLLGGAGAMTSGDAAVPRCVVGIQGASYQAAQYLAKVIQAESWASRGFRVSANTAAITKTRSMDHPVFAAAFGGAAAFNVETFTPRQSKTVNGLLAIHDWLHPEMPVPGRIRVHGGIHTLPYPLEIALRTAAAIGFARSPRLIRGLIAR